ncbi:acyl-CoA thioesterase-2 [Rhodoligotrophos appendicifer]|uniref:acyl-CoA thioesterase II n=1 Tax=Rhodoligotrophos appendicifer TaxID=987056 RepID=UPI0011870E4C|nr:acyl-CoA thioesterase II [Rhodoligotrophos appendicifer]
MSRAIDVLMRTLDLEKIEENLFRGSSPQAGWQRVFGGQVIGQALVAAIRTVAPERPAHSLHGYFMRPGDPQLPIIYEVHRDRDGASFSTRRVVAIQHGFPIFTMSASFQREEVGLEHQIAMPDVVGPEDLLSEQEMLAKYRGEMPENMRLYFERDRPIELRPVQIESYLNPRKTEPIQYVWIRATAPLPADRALHQCVLAYASDMTLLDTSLLPHGRSLFNRDMVMASLDHAMWLFRDFRADDWLLYAQDSPASMGGRGFTRGNIFDRNGVLVASVAQEGLIRIQRSATKKNAD